MDHQIQGLTLVNNEWVSRPVDVYQILAGAQQQNDTSNVPNSADTAALNVPQLGILSKTIFATPMISTILPANIRHKTLADVVVVGEDALHLKEIREYGHLHHVASKCDFRGRIMAASVFGHPPEMPNAPLNSSIISPRRTSAHRQKASLTNDGIKTLPPEVIVLALSSRTLMFLWACNSRTNTVNFIQKAIRLPTGSSRFEQFGRFLAIDSKCRAIAVAAQEGRFILYKTKSMHVWRKELEEGKDTTPIEDERILPIEGRIMFMEFLSSNNDQDDSHVVLLFLVTHKGKTKLTCFDWDYREDLSSATARTERVAMDSEDHNPSLLIPLSRRSDFLLVSSNHISLFSDVLSGVPSRTKISLQSETSSSSRPRDHGPKPQWVAWSKARRHPSFKGEALYIAREDGQVIYLDRGDSSLVSMNHAGDWPSRIDTAFACLSVDSSEFSNQFPDVLMAGGCGDDGFLYKVGAWPEEYPYGSTYLDTNSFSYLSTIPSWTPLNDCVVASLSGLKPPYESDRAVIFAANGNSPHGGISELRQGVPALIDDFFSGMTGCTRLWVIDYGSESTTNNGSSQRQHHVTFAISHPMETLLISAIRTQPSSGGELPGAWENGSWTVTQIGDEMFDDDFLRDGETISACAWSADFSIQVNRDEARILHRSTLRLKDSFPSKTPLLLAATRPGFNFIVVACRQSSEVYLETIPIFGDGTFNIDGVGRHRLDHDPTCLELIICGGKRCIFVSTFNAKAMILTLDESTYPPTFEENYFGTLRWDNLDMLCEGAVVLKSQTEEILACTTRTGHLLITRIAMDEHGKLTAGRHTSRRGDETGENPFEKQFLQLGDTSAQIIRCETDPSTAFVSCGPLFLRVSCSSSGSQLPDVESVWLTNRSNPSYLQAPVTAMYQLPYTSDKDAIGRNLGGFLFTVAGDHLLFSQLDSDVGHTGCAVLPRGPHRSGAVPRKLMTKAKPTNVVYLASIRRIIVATMEPREQDARTSGSGMARSSLKLLKLYDEQSQDSTEVKQEEEGEPNKGLLVAQYDLEDDERVYSITQWPLTTDQGKRYHLIIVGTGRINGSKKQVGRRLIFNTGRSGTRLQLQKESTYEDPVYCVAIWKNESTLNAVGRSLSLDRYDAQQGRWIRRAKIDLPSPGVHITCEPPFVYVSTQHHSLICYAVATGASPMNPDTETESFEQIFTDVRERSSTHNLPLDLNLRQVPMEGGRVVLTTDKKTATLVGLYHPRERRIKNATDSVFEAAMPRTVVRLQRGDIRPPWRRTAFTPGIWQDDIIGACSDGTIYSFSILSEEACALLRLLQNIIEAKNAADPSKQYSRLTPARLELRDILMNGAEGPQDDTSIVSARSVDPKHQSRGPGAAARRHIDGDLILRWFEGGGTMDDLLMRGVDKDVEPLFVGLAKGLFEERSTGAVEVLVDRVKEWLEQILMPVL